MRRIRTVSAELLRRELGLENVGQDGIWDGPVGQPGYVWLYRDGGRGKLGPLSLDTGQ